MKVKEINFFALFALILFLTFSCSKVPPSLNLSTYSALVSNYEGSTTIEVTSNGGWTATTVANWLTISPVSGSGNGTITVTAQNNYGTEDRSALIKITCDDLVKNFTISQTYTRLSLDLSTLTFAKTQESKQVAITANAPWEIVIPSQDTWLTVNTRTGSGNASVSFTANTNSGSARTSNVLFRYGSTQIALAVSQQRANNTPPTLPTLLTPSDAATDTRTIPQFSWQSSTDADSDPLTYTLSISKDNTTWKDTTLTKTSAFFRYNFDPNTTYYWKVRVSDGDENVTTATRSFRTGAKSGMADGEYSVYQNNTQGTYPVEIIFMGDGYIASDYYTGGLFDQNAATGIEAFFSVEPYKTYRNYFKVYKVAAFSNDSGITQTDLGIVKETAFSSYFSGGSSTSTNSTIVNNYAKKVSGIDDNKLKNTLIVLMLNQDRYAGTCWMWSDGKAIAICPVSVDNTAARQSANYRFPAVVNHEAGGHGFGRLADEYVSSANVGKTLPATAPSGETSAANFITWVGYGYYPNVDLTNNLQIIKWKHFIGLTGYEGVGAFERAYYYTYGAWRAEDNSCMNNNVPYYSAPARENMVKKIMTISGGTYSLQNFISNDVQKTPSAAAMTMTKSVSPLTFIPLAPPLMFR